MSVRMSTLLEGIDWPRIPSETGRLMLALDHQFAECEQWPHERLEAEQRNQLSLVVRHAMRTVPWYRDWSARTGTSADDILAPGGWPSLPVLSRRDLQRLGPLLHSDDPYDAHGPVRSANTSGSTGRPVTFLENDVTRLFLAAHALRTTRWHRRDPSVTLATILIDRRLRNRPGATGFANSRSWGWPLSLVYETGPMVSTHVWLPHARQLDWLARHEPHYLLTTPVNLQALLDLGQTMGFRPARLRDVATVAEAVDAGLRSQCLEQWAVPVIDTYSARETGCIAIQCPEGEGYHVMSESVMVEVLDEHDRPVVPGRTGKVVVTSLVNLAMPLLRYEIGDFAVAAGPCPCGRPHPLLERIVGRSRELWRMADGRLFWPDYQRTRLVADLPIRQHQFAQVGANLIEARLVVERPLTADEEAGIAAMMAERLPEPFQVRFAYPDEIPALPGGKFLYFVREVP